MPINRCTPPLFPGAGIDVITDTLAGSACIPWWVIMLPMNLTSLSLNCSLLGLRRTFFCEQRSIRATKRRSLSLSASWESSPSPKTRILLAMHSTPSRPSRAVINLFWNSSGALDIPNGRRSQLYLP